MSYPLFLITGISGAGKSTTAEALGKVLPELNVFDMDLIVTNGDYLAAAHNWLKIAYVSGVNGRLTVLLGNFPYPYDLRQFGLFSAFYPVHTLHLHCSKHERIKRLSARKGWSRRSLRGAVLQGEAMLARSESAVPPIPVINTGTMTPEAVAEAIKQWILEKL
ncbi:AAA family ATPase [Metabacillus sp. GX 13764]|uniref:AAA family ATPase n=1 Tax=Metabacillus kandeliae TaxID=2900151 RepID=UPI001E397257|nr:AAA family ATPase [Metabacillus kandeliae]MCD7034396.1 AAA family ATPase [Metabacillus kandeliae]